MGAVNRHGTVADGILHQGVQPPDIRASKTRVRQIHRAIKNGQ
jgi:hypothetical protein